MPQKIIPIKNLTTLSGAPVINNQNAVNAGRGYPALPQDYCLLEEIAHAGLGEARTLKGIVDSRIALKQIVRNGIDVPTVAAIIVQAFAHEILLTNLGKLPYRTDFGELKLEAVWGPAVSARIEGALTIGVATTNGAICLLETRFNPTESLLNVAEKFLLLACRDAMIARDESNS